MSDLIRRRDVVKVICENCKLETDFDRYRACGICRHVEAINSIPSAERKGEWISESGKIASFWVCSECDFPATVADEINDIKYFNFCPNCGADMRGADDEV